MYVGQSHLINPSAQEQRYLSQLLQPKLDEKHRKGGSPGVAESRPAGARRHSQAWHASVEQTMIFFDFA